MDWFEFMKHQKTNESEYKSNCELLKDNNYQQFLGNIFILLQISFC